MKDRRLFLALFATVAAAVVIAIYAVRIPGEIRPVTPELAAPLTGTTAPQVAVPAPLTTVKGETDMLQDVSVHAGDLVASPLTIEGQARGNWYFEASFPARIIDADGNVLAAVPAQAQGEWMTTDYVPFKATLEFSAPSTATGTLELAKDNPSGLPEKDDALRIPIRFK